MKFVLILLSLLALVFSVTHEVYYDYSEFYEEYGCSLKTTSKCCWSNYDNCCEPANGPRTCEDKRTLCCKRKAYDMQDGTYGIFFFY